MFSKACEYGIRAALHLAHLSESGRRASIQEVAAAIDSPVAFTAKILQSLAKSGIVISAKGPGGGYEIGEKQLDKIALADLVKAIDGDAIFKGCALGLSQCDGDRPCPVHHEFKDIRERLRVMLETTTLGGLADGLHKGATFLKR
ncbi:MAG: Rrf2 family transcriptional regulator [Bacteroidetes bacterium]|nr:MAG: Rrf2 family transcriptional regulator [Bacteroidota bacterium]